MFESDREGSQGRMNVHVFSPLRLHAGGGTSVHDSVGAGDEATVVPGSGVHEERGRRHRNRQHGFRTTLSTYFSFPFNRMRLSTWGRLQPSVSNGSNC